MAYTAALDDPLGADPARVGGKAAGLFRLAAAGLPVPRGFVVLPGAMAAVLGAPAPVLPPQAWSDAAVRAEAEHRAETMRRAPFPPGFSEEIARRLAELGDVDVAVRSSAVGEDAAEASAAGQYSTLLGRRGLEDVLEAIRACWASVHSHRAAIYRARTGAEPFDVRAAIVIQPMVRGDVFGVAFTADPGLREHDRLVIEMSAAGPEAVAGGTVTPERVEVARDGLAVRHHGTASLLDDASLRELARLSLAAESALGAPADIEWAHSAGGFVLLQLRPMTHPRRSRPSRRAGVIWTRRFSGERWTEAPTTLGWSIVERVLERFTHWNWVSRRYLRGSRLGKVHAGTPYFNITVFRHLLPKTPWTPTPEFVLELFPPEEQEEWRHRRWHLPSPGVIFLVGAEAFLRDKWRGHRFLWFTNPRDWAKVAALIDEAVTRLDPRPSTAEEAMRSLDLLAGRARRGRRLTAIERYVGVHLWSLLWANLFYQVLGVVLEKLGGEALQKRRPALVAGAGSKENLTLRTNAAVWRLAATAHEDPEVERVILSAPDGAAARAALEGVPGARRFLAALDALLERYGHRSRATWEVFSRRWRDEPGLVLEMVRAYLRGGISADPFLKDEEIAVARREAEAALDAAIALRSFPVRFTLGRIARWSLERARVFSLLRENQRFSFDRLMLLIGDLCRSAAAHLERTGRLARSGDVVFLTLGELSDLTAGRLSAPEAARRIAVRSRLAEASERAWAPAFLFEDERPQVEHEPSGRVLHGVGVSPGRITARVRIARSLDEIAALEPGEILVVKASDPGWTPYFATAGGLVTELGGLLSHAAVVAREYGLPAVADVPGATDTLRDGEEVTLDGDEGIVSRKE